MKTKGIRISDKISNIVSVEFSDILHVIPDGNSFYWSILYLYATGNLRNEQSIPDFEKKIKESEKEFLLTWKELSDFANKLLI